MGWIEIRNQITQLFQKYRYVLIVLLIGLILLLLPEKEHKQENTQMKIETAYQEPASLEESLADILSNIQGAGKVQVLLSQAAGERIVYQTDEDSVTSDSGMDLHLQTVIISSNREESGLIQQIHPPIYQGAIILCQGADSAAVRLSIVDAVANVTGLSTDKITVLKMK